MLRYGFRDSKYPSSKKQVRFATNPKGTSAKPEFAAKQFPRSQMQSLNTAREAPLVSICVPTYNSAAYLRATLLSIQRQTYENFEVIIGDNCSSDRTLDIIAEFLFDSRFRFYQNSENLGYAGNCNKLISTAQGELVAIYHGDDIYHPEIVAGEVAVLVDDPELAGVFTFMNHLQDEQVRPYKLLLEEDYRSPLIRIDLAMYLEYAAGRGQNPLVCPSAMIRRSVYEEIGGYDSAHRQIEDLDMWIRILAKHPLAVINRKYIDYRIHTKQDSSYFFSPERTEISANLSYLYRYLLTSSLRDHLLPRLSRHIASDLLNIATKMRLHGHHGPALKAIQDSRNHHRFDRFEAEWYLQISDTPLGRLLYEGRRIWQGVRRRLLRVIHLASLF